MVDFTVIEKTYNGKLIDHGLRSYHLAPRLREHITIVDADGSAQVYQVIAVIHPTTQQHQPQAILSCAILMMMIHSVHRSE